MTEFDQQVLETYIPLLKAIMSVKRPLEDPPTFVPQNAFEQWQVYENGVTRRVYYYVNDTWRYHALT